MREQREYAAAIRKFTAMKTIVHQVLLAFGVLLLIANFAARAADRVQCQNNKVLVWQDGAATEATDNIALPFDIVVATNGTFTVKSGRVRQLGEGDILGRDGMLIQPNGSITPVMDHVTMNRGRVLATKDGETAELREAMPLADGATISADGKITTPDGTSRKLLDGEILRPEGGALPARDTITMQNGRVMVQKDGSMLSVDPGRTIRMNDGTKVESDGTITSFSGERTQLAEGQIYVVEGVVRLKR
jgi:hypothetical protein